MVDLTEARDLALHLPEAIEEDHHGIPSFRIRGRVFATVPDDQHIRVMAGEDEIKAAVAEFPDACAEFSWGKRLACVVVTLEAVESRILQELLIEAWRRKAPRTLVRQHFPQT